MEISLMPKEMKKRYMAHGYSVIAFTDQKAFVSRNDLTDENGFESYSKVFFFEGYAKSAE